MVHSEFGFFPSARSGFSSSFDSSEYRPAQGPRIKIEVRWKEGDQEITRRAQEMVRNFKTKEKLDLDWVFGGSQIYTDPNDGTKVYYGDSGELVCLSNFSTATMDLPIKSSDSNDALLFEANPNAIPEIGTKVYVIFTPQTPENPESTGNSDESKEEEKPERPDGKKPNSE